MLGVAARAYYALVSHHPRHFVVSDGRAYVEHAQRLLTSPRAQGLGDTIWPPGASGIWALSLARDPSLGGVALLSLLASVCVVALVASSARRVAGARAGHVALILASAHFGYIHYVGFALSEGLFQLAVTFAVWSTLLALGIGRRAISPTGLLEGSTDGTRAAAAAPGTRAAAAMGAIGAGAAWGLASLVRPNALPVFLVALTALALAWLRRRDWRSARFVPAALFGLALVVAPAADRCTRLAGGARCLISNNVTMNMALGQADDVSGLEFRDPESSENSTGWYPPALLQHGYTGVGLVPATIYDTRRVLRWWWAQVASSPARAADRALRNGVDLFRVRYWPDMFGALDARTALAFGQAFFVFAIIPGIVGFLVLLRRVAIGSATSEHIFLVAAGAGVFVSAACSLGEARYRVPFDVLLIVPAAMLYVRAYTATPAPASARADARAALAALGASLVVAAAIHAVSHPAIALGMRLRAQQDAWRPQSAPLHVPAASRQVVSAPGDAWDGPLNHQFRCEPTCSELRVDFARREHPFGVRIALDHNDRYRLRFYRHGRSIAVVDVGPLDGPPGMRFAEVPSPEGVQQGVDAIGVVPLYGDGRYALGMLTLIGP